MKSSISKIFSWVLVCAMVLAQLLIPMPLQAQAASAVREADTDPDNQGVFPLVEQGISEAQETVR